MGKIKVLSIELANQIAAGEVIERPASVVKELLENSLDANATQINVEIEAGGINKIKITDNGEGIFKDDLPLAICAHATSKISKIDDLYNTHSLGFRGEALASIASVARVEITSRTQDEDVAHKLSYKEGHVNTEVTARLVGTTIEVRDLFYNVPVRKKFLKSIRTEYIAIENIVKRFAMSEHKIAVSLKNDGKLILNLKACKTNKDIAQRLQKIQGKTFIDNCIYIKNQYEDMKIQGYISNNNYQRSQNDKIWFYINKRMVKDRLLVNALIKAYEDLLMPGRYPSCVLYLTLLPTDVDINIHPQKHEVRFKDPRMVHDLLTMSIKGALAKEQSMLSVATDNEIAAVNILDSNQDNFVQDRENNQDLSIDLPLKNLAQGKVIEESKKISATQTVAKHQIDKNFSDNVFEYKQDNYIAPLKKWTILNQRFAVIILDNQSYLIDLLKFVQFKFLNHYNKATEPLARRCLLVPFRCEVDNVLQDKIEQCSLWFDFLGFDISPIGQTHVVIRQINKDLQAIDFNSFFIKFKNVNITSRDDLMNLLLKSLNLNLLVLDTKEQELIFNSVYQHMEHERKNDFSVLLNVDFCCNLLRFQKSYV